MLFPALPPFRTLAENYSTMLLTTTPTIEGKPIQQYLGIVTAEAIIGANIFKDLFAGIRDIVGGRSGTYERVIEEARQKAVKNPATFDALVDEYSDAASEKGNHGYIANADHILDPTLSSAVQALAKVGDISPSIKSADGYSVLKLVEKQPSRSQKFEDVRESIIESLKTRYINDAVANHIAEFSNKPVDADTAVMDTLRTRYGQVAAIPAIAPSVPTEK